MSWVKLYGKLRNWQYYNNPILLAVWIHILVEASHFDGVNDMGAHVSAGQLTIGTQKWANMVGITRNQLRYALKKLEEEGQIIAESKGKYTLITVVKWDEYQAKRKKNSPLESPLPSLLYRESIKRKRDKRLPSQSYSQDEDDEEAREEALREYKNAIS